MTAIGVPLVALHEANSIRADVPGSNAAVALDRPVLTENVQPQAAPAEAAVMAPTAHATMPPPAAASAIKQQQVSPPMVKQESAEVHTEQQRTATVAPAVPAAAPDFDTPIASPLVRPASSPLPAPPLSPLPATDAAAAAPQPGLPELQPLSAPDVSEPAAIHAEYEVYMQRFRAGDTLAQRWHRLAQNGKLDVIREDWDDWQHDVMLQQLQQQMGSGRGRGRGRGKRDEVDMLGLEDLGPRKSRQRRAPSTLQDYQVDTPVSASPAPGAVRPGEEAPTASGQRSGAGAGAGVEEDETSLSNDEAAADGQPARPRSSLQQQRRVYRPPNQPTQPYNHQVYRSNTTQQLQQPWSRWVPSQAQQMQQQQQQSSQPTAAAAAVPAGGNISGLMAQSPELVRELYQLGAHLGSTLSGAGRGAGGQQAFANPQAFASAMEQMCVRMFNGDTQAMVQQLASLYAQQQQQH